MKILTVVGARPQFIKAAAVSRVIQANYKNSITEVLVHTGQHFDHNMSDVFFEELGIPIPKHDLEISGGMHGEMTGRMLASIERVLIAERPDWLLIYGDTNSTLAAALAAAKLNIPIAHVEAGLRSFNNHMPEEINRIVADRLASLLFCPTDAAMCNLKKEGIVQGVSNVGDVMFDVSLYFRQRAEESSTVIADHDLTPFQYVLATCHRAENTDDPQRLCDIFNGLQDIARDIKVVVPLHPRTRKILQRLNLLDSLSSILITEPLPFLDIIALEKNAKVIITDSGGMQKEAFFFQVPCITIRDETEWIETVESKWNRLVGASHYRIVEAFKTIGKGDLDISPYGDGTAAEKIVRTIFEAKLHSL